MSVSAHPSKIVYWTNSENPSKNHSLLLSYQSQVTPHWDFKDPLLFSRCPSHNKDKIVAPTLTHKVPPHTHTIALGFLFKLVRRKVSPPALAQQIPNTVRPSQWSENVTFLNVGSKLPPSPPSSHWLAVVRLCCSALKDHRRRNFLQAIKHKLPEWSQEDWANIHTQSMHSASYCPRLCSPLLPSENYK